MKTMKRKLSEFLSQGVKDIADLTSYIRKRWLTFASDSFPNNPPSLVSKNNFSFSNLSTRYFNHENILTFHFDSDISLTQKEELYFETSFIYHYLYNKNHFLCLHETMFLKDNYESKKMFGSMQAFVENTSEELSWKINSTINEVKNFSDNLGNKNAFMNQTENEFFLNNSENISLSLFGSNLNSTLLPYISSGNVAFPATEQDIFLNENRRCSFVCNFPSKNQTLFKNWKSLSDMELRLYFCNEQHFNMPLESQKIVYSSKKIKIFTKECLKCLYKAFTINSESQKSNIKCYQSAMGEINFFELVKTILNLILNFPFSLCLEVVFDSGDSLFTDTNRIYVLFERQKELCTFVTNSFNFLTLNEQIEPWSNFGISMLFEEFGINKICSKVKRLYFGKNFEIKKLFQGHLQSSQYNEAVITNLVDHSPNLPGLTKISLPIVQDICKNKVRNANVNHPAGLNDMHMLTHIQYVTSYESKSKSKNIFEEFHKYNFSQLNKDDPLKVLTSVPSMTLKPETKCETHICENDCERMKIYPKEMRTIQGEIYFRNKDITKSHQHYFDNSRSSKDKVVLNTQNFLDNSTLTKNVNADNKLENYISNQKNNSNINILDTMKNESHSDLNKNIESEYIEHINHGYKVIDFAKSNSSYDEFTLLENLSSDTENLCNTPRDLATDRDTMKNGSYSDLNKDIESKSVEHINHRYKEIDFAQSISSHDELTLLKDLSIESESLCNKPRNLVIDREHFNSRKCKRKRKDMVECPNKKVQTEKYQRTEINAPSVKREKLNIKRCIVLLKKIEPSQYKALTATENTSDSLRNHKDKTTKPFKGAESKFTENLLNNESGKFQAMNEANNLRYNLRNSKDKKSSAGKKRKYQQNTSDSRLYFTSETDESNHSTEFGAFNMESNFSGQELPSISKRFRPTRNKREASETGNKIRNNNIEPENTKKRERKQTLKNLSTPKIIADNLSSPVAKRRRGTKSVNLCFSVKAANHEEKCDKLSNKSRNSKSDLFVITSSLNTIYSSDGNSSIKYKSIQGKFETPLSSQLQCHAKSLKRKREKSKSATLPESGGSIRGTISDFRQPVDEIVKVTKRIKSDKILQSEDSKSISSRNYLPECSKVVPIDKKVIKLQEENDGVMYVYNSGTIQVATIDDLCLKSRRKESLKSKTRSKHFTA